MFFALHIAEDNGGRANGIGSSMSWTGSKVDVALKCRHQIHKSRRMQHYLYIIYFVQKLHSSIFNF